VCLAAAVMSFHLVPTFAGLSGCPVQQAIMEFCCHIKTALLVSSTAILPQTSVLQNLYTTAEKIKLTQKQKQEALCQLKDGSMSPMQGNVNNHTKTKSLKP
jgi:hypothetical protein